MSDDPDPDEIADAVRESLEPGTVIDDRVILSKRQAALVLFTPATLAGVLGLASGRATAQSGGVLGSDSEPIDAALGNYGESETADGWEITIDGATFQLNE